MKAQNLCLQLEMLSSFLSLSKILSASLTRVFQETKKENLIDLKKLTLRIQKPDMVALKCWFCFCWFLVFFCVFCFFISLFLCLFFFVFCFFLFLFFLSNFVCFFKFLHGCFCFGKPWSTSNYVLSLRWTFVVYIRGFWRILAVQWATPLCDSTSHWLLTVVNSEINLLSTTFYMV